MKKTCYFLLSLSLTIIAVFLTGCDDNSSTPNDKSGEMTVPSIEEILPEEVFQEKDAPPEITYVLNTNSRRFHKPSCRSVEQMKPENYQETSASREEVLEMGYTPCGNCKP